MRWINKDTEVYCSFAKNAGNTGCQMMNTAFHYYGLNKIYKSFSVDDIESAVNAVKVLDIKGFAITMPYKKQILAYVDEVNKSATLGAANTVINNNGVLIAYNTDYLAAYQVLKDYNPNQNMYILGNGGYAAAVKEAASKLNIDYINITRDNWEDIDNIKNSLVYNCTPLKLEFDNSVAYIDCLVNTETGSKLAFKQASYQFELYTGLKFPFL